MFFYNIRIFTKPLVDRLTHQIRQMAKRSSPLTPMPILLHTANTRVVAQYVVIRWIRDVAEGATHLLASAYITPAYFGTAIETFDVGHNKSVGSAADALTAHVANYPIETFCVLAERLGFGHRVTKEEERIRLVRKLLDARKSLGYRDAEIIKQTVDGMCAESIRFQRWWRRTIPDSNSAACIVFKDNEYVIQWVVIASTPIDQPLTPEIVRPILVQVFRNHMKNPKRGEYCVNPRCKEWAVSKIVTSVMHLLQLPLDPMNKLMGGNTPLKK